jgi:hypothetical protein
MRMHNPPLIRTTPGLSARQNGVRSAASLAEVVHPTSPTWTYFARFVRHPSRTWPELSADPHRVRFGLLAVFGVGLGYGIVEAGIAISGGTPSPP